MEQLFNSLTLFFSSDAPLSGLTDFALLCVRLTLGGAIFFFGVEKALDLRGHFRDFADSGFHPVWLTASLVFLTEFVGGAAIIFGIVMPIAAVAVAFEMVVGTIIKKFIWQKGFGDYSYDILLFTLCFVTLAFGAGDFTLSAIF